MHDHSKKQSRKAKLLGGALVGAVLSLGVVAGSAAADSSPSAVNAVQESPAAVKLVGGVITLLRSGIRW
jgi:hypothetical protein